MLALAVTLQTGVWRLDGPSSAGRSPHAVATAGPLELEGRVTKVEPETRTVQLSSGILGLGTTTFSLSDQTQILVGRKEGGLGDLQRGARVRVLLEASADARVARVIELLVSGGAGQRREAVPEGRVNAETSAARGHESVLPRAVGAAEPRGPSGNTAVAEPRSAADAAGAQGVPRARIDAAPSSHPPSAGRAAAPAAVTPRPVEGPSQLALSDAATASRHSGTVVEVGSDRLVVVELGLAGKEERLHISVTPTTRVVESVRNPRATGLEDQFTTTPTTLTDVRTGDYVVVEVRREGNALVAQSLIVTLRSSDK
jgi:hypothetical protein